MHTVESSWRQLVGECCVERVNLAALQFLQLPVAQHGQDVHIQQVRIPLTRFGFDSLPPPAGGADVKPVLDPLPQCRTIRENKITAPDLLDKLCALNLSLALAGGPWQRPPNRLALTGLRIANRQHRVPIALTAFAYMPSHWLPPSV